MDDAKATIIQIDEFLGLRTRGWIERHQQKCKHPKAIIDEHLGTLECEECGASINPYLYLLRLVKRADEWKQFARWAEGLRQEIKKRQLHIEELKRVERNTRNRIRRLEGKLALMEPSR